MARKPLVENPPQPTSSDEEDDDSSKEDEEISLQEETAVNLGDDDKLNHEEAEEDEDDESDDEEEAEEDGKDETPVKALSAVHQDDSDSESDPPSLSPSQFTVKPIVAKPAESKHKKAEKKKKIKSLDKVTSPAPLTTPSVTSVVEEPKNSGSAKLWNEDDEITVFKGLTTFKGGKGYDPATDSGAFHDFIKESFVFPVTKTQLTEKIRRLKKKYRTNVAKARDGEDPVFTKPHEQTSFEFSKKIWGSKANTENSNTTTENVNATATVNSNAKAGTKRKAKTSVSVNGGNEVAGVNGGNEVAGVANVLALPIKENVGSSVGVSGKKQKTVTKKEVANGEANEPLKKEKEEEVVEDEPLISFNHSTTLFGLKYGQVEEMLLDSLSKTENDKVNELRKKWSNFQMDELKLYIRRTELLKETAMLVVDDRKP